MHRYPAPSDILGFADGIAVSPNGRSVYVSDYYGTLTHFFAGATQGQLTWDGCVSADGSGESCARAITGGSGDPFDAIGGVAVSPNASASNSSVFFTSQLGAVSHLFARAMQGQLTYDRCLSDDGSEDTCGDIPGSGQPLAGAEGIAVNPRGTAVYVATSDDAGGVAPLAASPPDGGGFTSLVGCLNAGNQNGLAEYRRPARTLWPGPPVSSSVPTAPRSTSLRTLWAPCRTSSPTRRAGAAEMAGMHQRRRDGRRLQARAEPRHAAGAGRGARN